MSLLEDLTSKDPVRIWSSSCAVRTLRDKRQLELLAANLDLIRKKTKNVDLGGALRPDSSHLEFAFKKLEYFRSSDGCLCGLYLMDDLYDPAIEQSAGNIQISDVVIGPNGWIDHQVCICSVCGTSYRVEQREYHYSWWAWQRA